MNIILTKELISTKLLDKNKKLNGKSSFLKEVLSFYTIQDIYNIYYEITTPICPICKKNQLKFLSFSKGYTKFCSKKCEVNNPERLKKFSDTFKNKSKEEIDKITLKRKRTNLKNNGSENYNNINKKIKTTLKKYKVENISQLEKTKKKVKQTKFEKYGNENYNNKEKNRITSIKNGTYKTRIEKLKDYFKQNHNRNSFSSLHLKNFDKWNDKDFIMNYPTLKCGVSFKSVPTVNIFFAAFISAFI